MSLKERRVDFFSFHFSPRRWHLWRSRTRPLFSLFSSSSNLQSPSRDLPAASRCERASTQNANKMSRAGRSTSVQKKQAFVERPRERAVDGKSRHHHLSRSLSPSIHLQTLPRSSSEIFLGLDIIHVAEFVHRKGGDPESLSGGSISSPIGERRFFCSPFSLSFPSS